MTPETLGRYEILGELGKGAMGVVYLARDPIIERQLAIKTFRMAYSAREKEVQQFRERFLREAQAIGRLSHPNIVTVHDVGQEDDEYFIAMEYVKGINLKQKMQATDGPLPLDFVIEVTAQIAEGLAGAHEKGIVHRDVKPANIIITQSMRVKITDFGIARIEQSNLTVAGQLLGTPNYMAPEQIQGKAVDARTDVFSLGVLLYEMLTRKKPFAGENLTQVTHRIVYDDFTSPNEFTQNLPAQLLAILDRALQKDPEKRYQDAAEMARELRTLQEPTEPLSGQIPTVQPPTGTTPAGAEDVSEPPVTPAGGQPPAPSAPPSPAAAATPASPAVEPAEEPAPVPPATETPPPTLEPRPPVPSTPSAATASPAPAAETPPAAKTAEAVPPGPKPDRQTEAPPSPEPPPPPPVPASFASGPLSTSPPPKGPTAVSGPIAAPKTPAPKTGSPQAAPPQVKRPPAPRSASAKAPFRSSPVTWGMAAAALVVVGLAALLILGGGSGDAEPSVDAREPSLLDQLRKEEERLIREARQPPPSESAETTLQRFLAGMSRNPLSVELPRVYVELAERADREHDIVRERYVPERMALAEAFISAKQYESAYDVLELVLLADPDNEEALGRAGDIESFLDRKRRDRIRASQQASTRPPPRRSPPPAAPPSPPKPVPVDLAISFRTLIAEGSVTVLADGEPIWRAPFAFDNRKLFKRKYLKAERGFDESYTLASGLVELKVTVEVDAKDGPLSQVNELRATLMAGARPTLKIEVTEDGTLKTTWIP